MLRVRLAEAGVATFGELVADCEHTIEVVARFLALLELYRETVILFEQDRRAGGADASAGPAAASRRHGRRPSWTGLRRDEEEYG